MSKENGTPFVLFSHIEPVADKQLYDFPEPLVEGTLQFVGKAVRDDIIAKGIAISRDFNERLIANTNEFIASGGRVTIFPRHGDAMPSVLGGLATGIPAGRVLQLFRTEGGDPNWVYYAGEILPTSKGKDLQVLIQGAAFTGTSIRSRHIKTEVQEADDGERVRAGIDGYIEGIDFADDPAVIGAGVVQTWEDKTSWHSVVDEESPEDKIMEINWEEVTLEDLQQNRADIAESLSEAARQPLQEQISGLEGSNHELQAQTEELRQKIAELQDAANRTAAVQKELTEAQALLENSKENLSEVRGVVGSLTLDRAFLQAAQDQLTSLVTKHLSELCESEDDIPEQIETAKEKAYMEFAVSREPNPIRGKGVIYNEDEDEPTDRQPKLSDEQKDMLRFL